MFVVQLGEHPRSRHSSPSTRHNSLGVPRPAGGEFGATTIAAASGGRRLLTALASAAVRAAASTETDAK
ncbi:hypothetical protein OG585_47280 (plasmid) [Streptomyces sp. NBC_01340]|uniref:hypothetical protein n=1 Tax=unclassified Streptomyces TaxID=2593676 RepID=UPI00225651A7|nr:MULTISPECIES: hypothetical protein [unclassified Streptomyces]MCX4461145.1 hypothetical protein [Streptomyces sp. NBC_01719]MCX4499526.1 hypothetical protein [Streptomyces sp. NBC_01728]WSI44665.1 hypothetical protein OG585_47280 [Streptomyces sp. NBC_01340]